MKKNLDLKKMLKQIDNFVTSDFLFDMECKQLPNSKPYTQEDAKKMISVIGKVYLIAHCIYCKACCPKFTKCCKK